MSESRGASRNAAVAVAASIPSGYLGLRWKYPTLWQDLMYYHQLMGARKTVDKLKQTRTRIVDIFEERARERPNHPCVLYQDEMYTYDEVYRNTNRAARWISGSDPHLEKGDIACVMLHNGPSFVWIWLGLSKLGIISSFINFNLKNDALLHCIRVSDAKKLIFGSEFLPAVVDIMPALQKMNIDLWMINDARIPSLTAPAGVVAMDIATASGEHLPNVTVADMTGAAGFVFTSGTTGMPKPAVMTHLRFLKTPIAHHAFTKLGPDDVYYIPMPMYHSAALLISVGGSLLKGCTMAIAKKFSASRFWDDIRRFKATIFQYIGEICRYLCAQPKKENDGQYPRPVRAIGNGLQTEIWAEFRDRFQIDLMEFYGATEGVFAIRNVDGHVGSVGRYTGLLKNRLDIAEIVDCDYESGEPKRGENGLCVRLPSGRPGLMLFRLQSAESYPGYYGPRELSEKKIVRNVRRQGDAYANTGDLMRIDPDGRVYFMDRLGDTFRWHGENVSTLEVSSVLNSFPAVYEAIVYGVHVPGHEGRAGMAAIVPKEGATLDFKQLYQHMASSLPDYARPKFLRLVSELELTGTFKPKKTNLVRMGFAPEENSDVYIENTAGKTYESITQEHISSMLAGESRL